MQLFGALLFIVLCIIAPAADAAGVPQQARAHYFAGRYEQSASMAAKEGSSESLAYAAQSLIADAITRPGGFCIACLERAEELATRAMTLDPNRAEGYIQKSIAIGFRGRAIGVSHARSENLAEQAKSLLDKALTIEPSNLWAQASLGAWHLEIVQHAGPVLAEIAYGADRRTGLGLYRNAIARGSEIQILHVHFALALLAMQDSDTTDEATAALHHALSIQTTDALSRHAQAQAKKLLTALHADNKRELIDLVRQLQGYPS